MKFLCTLILILTTSFAAVAQEDLSNASDIFLDGEVAMLQGKYKKAIRLFEKALRIKPDLRAAQRGIGQVYDLMKQPHFALEYYVEVLNNDEYFSRVLYYQVAECYFKLGEYDKAIVAFERFNFLQAENDQKFTVNGEKERVLELELAGKLDDAIRACQVAKDSTAFRENVVVTNLGPTINTRHDEYFPFLSNNQKILFFTKRKGYKSDENLFFSLFDKGGWRIGKTVGESFNTDLNEGMVTMVRDGRTMYFTACNRDNVQGPCDIWEATVDGTTFSYLQPLRGDANTPSWESQAAVSCDGRTLYFSSMWEGPGHQGGADIWYAKKLPSGLWSSPINMGPKINTPKDEESPFITNDGNTLYFCSTGHLGMGSADIFFSMKNSDDSTWTIPINLGPTVNSPYEELGFFLSADGQTGYFSSDRPRGYGGKDIYKVQLTDELTSSPITFVEGFVTDAATNAQIFTTIEMEDGEVIRTDRAGRFFLCLPANSTFYTKIGLEDYHPWEKYFLIPESDNRLFHQLKLPLRPLQDPSELIKAVDTPVETDSTEVLEPAVDEAIPEDTTASFFPPPRIRLRKYYNHSIFFNFEADEAENSELIKLDEFLRSIQGKEVLRLEISGYADDIGTDIFNLELSEKRAKKIALYLYDRNFRISNIGMQGYGSVRDDKPNYQNRRVDIKIVTIE
ncbi:MAG: tetratricopeptide repeat protein [Bacteroidota bacterium]